MLIGCTTLLLLGCEEVVDLDIEEEQSRLVVVSQFNPDSVFSAVVSRSRSILSSEPFEYIDNAIVGVYHEGELKEELKPEFDPVFNRTIYKGETVKPIVGESYTIWVEALDLEDINGTDNVPEPVPVLDFEVSNTVIRPTFGLTAFQYFFDVKVRFIDPPIKGNRYHLAFYYQPVENVTNGEDTIQRPIGRPVPVQLENTANDFPFLAHYNFGVLIDDEINNGGVFEYSFEAGTFPVATDRFLPNIKVELRSVSDIYFDYNQSLSRQLQQTDSLFAEPIILSNNIENGFGVFAGYVSSVDSSGFEF